MSSPLPDKTPTRLVAKVAAQVSFLQSAAKVAQLPRPNVPEIAIAGRSNAGKSTALNVICERRRMAFASKTPGRTRLINLFSLNWQNQELGRLVDLPGYGYAAVDAGTLRAWQQELSRYLAGRQNLSGLILVTDIRHALGPLDRQMLAWFGQRRRPVHLLLTKADKLNRADQQRALAKAQTAIEAADPDWGQPVTVSLFSGLRRTGRDEILDRISLWLGLEASGPEIEQKKAGSSAAGDNAFVKAPAQGGEAGDMTSVV
ncbi:MAG: ribosome biogenesis GTP-binding protein YihA/YsxC [Burkholderiaceae bacterium]